MSNAAHSHDDDDEAPGSHEEHGSGHAEEPWLICYADLMTLLFGFFAMMFTYASFEEEDTVKMRKEVARYFGGSYVSPAETLAERVKFEWSRGAYSNDMALKANRDGLEISFITSVLFETGSADLLPQAIPPVRTLGALIRSSDANFDIRVEGHTDDIPINPGGKFPSNWELSAARAGTIVRVFQSMGITEDQLAAIGYGSGRPAYPNRDKSGKILPDNQAHNRRVVVKVLLPTGEIIPEKLKPSIMEEYRAPAGVEPGAKRDGTTDPQAQSGGSQAPPLNSATPAERKTGT